MYPTVGRCWAYEQAQMLEYMCAWCDYELKDLYDEKERAFVCGVSESEIRKDVLAIVLSKPLEESRKKAQSVYNRGAWPKFYFTRGGKGGIRRKTYLENVGGKPPTNLWMYSDTGHTDEAKKELISIFNGRASFDTPKPSRLIEFILKIASDKDAIILDSFAGSGTTAHAVLNMNKADGGKRRFILVEMEDYADSITAERVKRVISGYGSGKNATEGTGGGFSFYDLGEPLMNGGELNENVGVEKIREYVWFMETRQPYSAAPLDNPYLLGLYNGTAWYFYYKCSEVTTLNYAFLSKIKKLTDQTVIYADRCAMNEDDLAEIGITFKKIPRDIAKL